MTQVLAPFRPFDPAQERVRFAERSARRVRPFLAGQALADSVRTLLVHESMRLPVYHFPREDVQMDLLEVVEETEEETRYSVRVGERTAERAAWTDAGLEGYVAFEWDAMDAWYEEDDEVFAHARDPYHRVDVLNSTRHVRVEVDGVTVADTRRPRLLFETGIPKRYYIPKLDVRMDLLTSTATHTVCPYKGTASYWSVTVGGRTHEDLVWGYPLPIPECPKIENHLCFYNEKVDIWVDGELEERPQTPFA
jgi:uncharacterized protein (DUF427 family)